MGRILFISTLVYCLIFAGLILVDGRYLALAFPMIILLIFGISDSPVTPDILGTRKIQPERAFPLSRIQVEITITNSGDFIHWIGIQDMLPDGLEIIEGSPKLLSSLRHGESVRLNYTVQGKRGIYQFEGINTTIQGGFGLLSKNNIFPLQGKIFILPTIPPPRRVMIRTRQTRRYSGTIPSRTAGIGTDFFNIRNYLSGDPLRYINWQVSSRFPEKLFTNEFERERTADIWLILDGRQRSNYLSNQQELFEQIVLAGAGLAQGLLSEGNRVGLLVYGGYLQWTYPGYGKIQFERIIRSLAQAKPGSLFVFNDLDNLPTRAFPINSHLILISPLHKDDVAVVNRLRARGYSILVISPDPVQFESDELELEESGRVGLRIAKLERSLILKQLMNAGIHLINWDTSIQFERAVQARLKYSINSPLRRNSV